MELVLEHEEIVTLLREALHARGMVIPENSVVRIRRNNKRGTLRAAFITPRKQGVPIEQP
jgi:hypothetical protein